MDRGLIIRSTSIQHLPLVLEKLKERFPSANLDILTHRNAVHSLGDYFKPDSVILYGSRSCFSIRGVIKGGVWRRLKKRYDFVVVPVENIQGSGYENVLRVALSVMPQKIILVNKRGDIAIKSFTGCLRSLLGYVSLFPVSLLLSLCFAVYFLPGFTFSILKRALRS